MSNKWRVYAAAALVVGAASLWGLLHEANPSNGHESAMPVAAASATVALTGTIARDPPPVAASAPQPVPPGRFELVSVDVPPLDAPARKGAAVIGVDGLPPKTYRVGDAIVGAVVLQSVQPRSAALGPLDGPPAVVLQIAAPGTSPAASPTANAAAPRSGPSDIQPPIRAASAPPVNRQAVPVSDPDHGVDTSNR